MCCNGSNREYANSMYINAVHLKRKVDNMALVACKAKLALIGVDGGHIDKTRLLRVKECLYIGSVLLQYWSDAQISLNLFGIAGEMEDQK